VRRATAGQRLQAGGRTHLRIHAVASANRCRAERGGAVFGALSLRSTLSFDLVGEVEVDEFAGQLVDLAVAGSGGFDFVVASGSLLFGSAEAEGLSRGFLRRGHEQTDGVDDGDDVFVVALHLLFQAVENYLYFSDLVP